MNRFALLIGIGWTSVLLEFVRPGWVIPGVAGAVLLVFAFSRLLPDHAALTMMVSAPFLAIAAWMLAMALRARRNKRTL